VVRGGWRREKGEERGERREERGERRGAQSACISTGADPLA